MRYRGAITVPAGTLKSAPVREAVSLTYGRINEVEILFPPGSAGRVNLIVLYHEAQIFPTSPENSFVGDDHLIEFTDHFPVDDDPLEVVLVGWSPDATLDHTVYVDFSVEAEQQLAALYPASPALPTGATK